jgi:2-polyprenyl-3-methyl-5-hydroxy-6-metoxy-1,4-benzoquinol methylase
MNIRTLGLYFLLAAGVPAQQPVGEDAVWRDYLTWLRGVDPRSDVSKLYRAKLVAGGVAEARADELVNLILNKLTPLHHDDLVALNFDRTYSLDTPYFNTRPNAFLVRVTEDMTRGTALDVAMGQGRNAVYLAGQGWTVTGFDIAGKGLEVAQAEAARRNVKITTVKSSYQDFDFGAEKWDLVVFSYAWVPLADAAFIRRVRASLKPNGVVVIEAPAEDPLKPAKEREWPPEPTDEVNTMMKAWTTGFRVLHYEDTIDMCDWRSRKARVLRLMARKWNAE